MYGTSITVLMGIFFEGSQICRALGSKGFRLSQLLSVIVMAESVYTHMHTHIMYLTHHTNLHSERKTCP